VTILNVGPGGFTTIEGAVNAAANGDTIEIAAGTYREQVTINGKDLTVHGAGDGVGGTIIESPDAASLVVNATDSNAARPNKFAVVAVIGDANVTIDGLAVDGREQGFQNRADYDFVGVYVLNSDAVSSGTFARLQINPDGANWVTIARLDGVQIGKNVNAILDASLPAGATITVTAAPPPAGTTADMILRHGADGLHEIYDIGNNAILAAYQLGQVGTDWAFVTLGGFVGSDTTDMILRNSNTGGFEVYDISNNNIPNAAFMGTVGLEWQVMGFGNFSSFGETDMMLRNVNTGGIEVYDINNNQITGANFLGTVGLNWQVGGFGNFSGRGTSDMILRNTTTGGLEVYDINSNQITGAAFTGTVGLDWQIIGVGNFSSMPGETDMIMGNTKTGGLEVYDIANNQITGAAFLGTVGLDWQFAGVAPVHGPGASDLVLRNVNTGAFEVYNIANNQITGAALLGTVGLDWLGGFAANPPNGSTGNSSQAAQLVQAMAGFGGRSGAAENVNTVPLDADTSQQTLLTPPQHA
jgi:Pectinesterase